MFQLLLNTSPYKKRKKENSIWNSFPSIDFGLFLLGCLLYFITESFPLLAILIASSLDDLHYFSATPTIHKKDINNFISNSVWWVHKLFIHTPLLFAVNNNKNVSVYFLRGVDRKIFLRVLVAGLRFNGLISFYTFFSKDSFENCSCLTKLIYFQ